MENYFTINLDVLSSVLYWWRILEATVRRRLKARGRRLNSRTSEHQRTPDSRDHYWTRAHPKASIPTLKPNSTQEPTSSKARHIMLILQQSRNTALSIKIQDAQSHTKPIDTSRLTTGHFIALQRKEVQLHSWLTQASLTRKPWQVASPTPTKGSNLHNKKELQTSSIQKGHPKHSNLNKVKRQRNIHQVKEHDECPPN